MTPQTTDTLDLREYLQVVRRRKWTIIQTFVLVVVAAIVVTSLQTPRYATSARLIIEPANSLSQDTALLSLLYGDRELETQRELVATIPVAERVAESLDLPQTMARSLLGAVRVNVVGSTSILEITAESSDPAFAARLADSFALSYLDFRRAEELSRAQESARVVEDLLQQKRARLAQVDAAIVTNDSAEGTPGDTLDRERSSLLSDIDRLARQLDAFQAADLTTAIGGRIVVPAGVPAKPSSPNLARAIMLAVVLGLALGTGLAFVRDHLDDVVRTEDDTVHIVGRPVLGHIPTWAAAEAGGGRLVTLVEPSSVVAEAYRTLRTNVRFLNVSGNARSILVTSASEGEGKTVTASNLAVALSRSGARVLLVGADLRRPSMHELFGIDRGPGLSDVLAGNVELAQVIVDIGVPNLRIVPSGHIPPNPSELLGSMAMTRLTEEFASLADFVIYDGPPVLAVADALELAPKVGSTILVVDHGQTGRSALRATRSRIEGVGGLLVGTVINNVEHGSGYYPYRYYGQSTTSAKS